MAMVDHTLWCCCSASTNVYIINQREKTGDFRVVIPLKTKSCTVEYVCHDNKSLYDDWKQKLKCPIVGLATLCLAEKIHCIDQTLMNLLHPLDGT